MEFQKFPSLENTYKDDIVQSVKDHPLTNSVQWVVTEKVDGCNLGIYCDGKKVKIASRNQFTGDQFYNCHKIIKPYHKDIFDIFETVKLWCEDQIDYIIIYGELYGQGIQNRVQYGKRDFAAFDIYVNGGPLEFHEVQELLHFSEIESVPVLAICETLDEALNYDETFNSELTPDNFEGENIAEGIVIVPSSPLYDKYGKRIYLKKKSDRFKEIEKKPKKVKSKKLNQEQTEQLNAVMEYVTESRVYSALSKIGPITSKDFGRLLGATVQDAIEEYMTDGNEKPDKQVRKILGKRAANVVRKVFLEQI